MAGNPVSPDSAWTYFGSSTTRTASLCNYSYVTCTNGQIARAPEVKELARALKYDPNLMYEYVRNSVQTEFMFGSHKGALGAIIDSSADPFDQAELLYELLTEAGIPARFHYGDITLTGAQFYAWSGVQDAQAACNLLSSGGIPAVVNSDQDATCTQTGNVTTVTMSHIWVEADINGASYEFDPSFKVNTIKSGINVLSAAGLVSGQAMNAAASGASSGTLGGFSSINNLNTAGLQLVLQTYATNIGARLSQSDMQSADMSDVVGGLVLEPAQRPVGGWLQSSLPYVSNTRATWSTIPDQFRVKVGLTTVNSANASDGNIAVSLFGDEIYGRRVDLVEVPDKSTAIKNSVFASWKETLFINYQLVQQGPDQGPGGQGKLEIDVNHPFAGVGDAGTAGSYGDITTYKIFGSLLPTSIVLGWGNVSPALSAKWGRESSNDRYTFIVGNVPPGNDGAQPQATSGDLIRAKIGATYLAEFSKSLDVQSRISGGLGQNLHTVGVVTAITHINTNAYHVAFDDIVEGWSSPDGSSPWGLASTLQIFANMAQANYDEAWAEYWNEVATDPDFDPDDVPDGTEFQDAENLAANPPQSNHATVNPNGDEVEIPAFPDGISIDDEVSVVDLETAVSVTNLADDAAKRRAALHSIATVGAALEGSVYEQLTDIPDASSTARRLAWGNLANSPETAVAVSKQVITIPALSTLNSANLTYDGSTGAPLPTGSLPAAKSEYADLMRAQDTANINQYSQAGYNVIASADAMLGPGSILGPETYSTSTVQSEVFTRLPSMQRGGAFIATKYDSNGDPTSIAHVVVREGGFSKGGGGPTTTAPAKFDSTEALNLLKDKFDDRSTALGVDLASGQAGYESPVLNSIGQGDFPSKLELRMAVRGDGIVPVSTNVTNFNQRETDLVTNQDDSITLSSSGMRALGDRARPQAAANSLSLFVTLQDIYSNAPSSTRELSASIAADWWMTNILNNVADVLHGTSSEEFVQTSAGVFLPMVGAAKLTVAGSTRIVRPISGLSGSPTMITDDGSAFQPESMVRYRYDDDLTLTLTGENEDTRNYQYWVDAISYTANLLPRGQGFRLGTWTFPAGTSLTYHYLSYTDSNFIGYLYTNSITNNFGQTLSLPSIQFLMTGATFSDAVGGVYSITYRGPTSNDGAYRIQSVFTPLSATVPAVTYGFDTLGRVNSISDAVTNTTPSTRNPYTLFIADGYRGERDDPVGGSYSVTTQRNGYLKLYTDEIGRTTQAMLDGRGRTLEHVFPEGDQNLFRYDANDNEIQNRHVAKPCTSPCTPLADIITSATYDQAWNKPITITDGNQHTTDLSYVPAGQGGAGELLSVVQPDPITGAEGQGPSYNYVYDGVGHVLTEKNPIGTVSQYSYDSASGFLIKSVTDPGGVAATMVYTNDALGNVIKAVGPRTDVVQDAYVTYDALRRPVYEIGVDPDGSGPLVRKIVHHLYDQGDREYRTEIGTGSATDGTDFSITSYTLKAFDPVGNVIETTVGHP